MQSRDYTPPGARFDLGEVEASIAPHAARLTSAQRDRLRPILWEDVASEYDARFFTAHVRGLPIALTPAFLQVESLWARDERRHYQGAHCAYRAVHGWTPREDTRLAARRADFEPLAHLFGDELSILVLCAYDELCTVRAYRANLPSYDLLGPLFGKLMRAVAADEAWHYSRFLDLLLTQHGERIDEALDWVRCVRATEGVTYANTFVLDHDDDVFDESIYDQAERALTSQLLRAARRRAAGERVQLALATG